MAYDKYEDRLTTIKNHEEIEKLICEVLGYDPKKTKFFREGKFDVKDCVMMHNAIDKLGQLEDIEENIGIDLITLFKALKGIWIKDNDRAYYVGCPYLRYAENWNRQLELQFRVGDIWYYVKDYGKTWALTKEELEK